MAAGLWNRIKSRCRRTPSFGDLGRTIPLSTEFGFDRGTPIDRYYIESFLVAHADEIKGRTLEIGDDTYTARFGGSRTTQRDVLHVHSRNPSATIVGDLSKRGTLPPEVFDCLVITQTLHCIYDMRAAVEELYGSLRKGGVLLLTSPGISQIARDEWGGENWFWSITGASARRLFGDVFGAANVTVRVHGNVFAATAFLQGVAVEEVQKAKLNVVDDAYPVTITVRAQKIS
jgi:hypothetical protein